MNKDLFIETERMLIYPISNEAMQEIIDREQDPEMKKAYGEMLSGCMEKPEQRAWYAVWNMELKDESKVIVGDLCFKGLGDDGMVEIGYGTHEEYQNKGYMTEAVIAMSEWASTQAGVTRVEAETEPGNAASQRVLAKAGFVANGQIGEEGPRFIFKGRP